MLNRLRHVTSRRQRIGSLLTLPTLLLLLVLWVTGAGAATLGPIQNASNDSANSINAHVAQDPSGNVHLVWDSQDGSARGVRYAKGIWNGSSYNFAASTLIADVAGYSYSTPNVAVASNGTIMVSWSESDGVHVQTWSADAGQPSGVPAFLGPGLGSSIATDHANRFHVVWNGDFQGQYCQFENGTCTIRNTFADTQINRPAVAVDAADNVHVVWDVGSGIGYRSHAPGAPFGVADVIDTGGNFASIAADGQGSVHIVYSRDFAIQYCRRTFGSACVDQHTSVQDQDLAPVIGANQDGTVVAVFRDSTTKELYYDVRESGGWTGPRLIARGTTNPTMSPRPYSNRLSVTWSDNYDIQHALILAGGAGPISTPTPTAPPAPSPTPTPPAIPAPRGTLVLNGGNRYTNSLTVSARITNSGGPATAYALSTSGQTINGQWTPDGTGSQTMSLTLPVPAGCQPAMVTATLSGPGGAVSFSAAIIYDAGVKATVAAMNPNLATNTRPIGGARLAAMTSSYGDNAFTNQTFALLYIDAQSGECSGINGYFIGTASDSITSPTDGRWIVFQPGTAGLINIPPSVQDGQTYAFKVFLRDAAGNVTASGQDASTTYDTVAPSVIGATTVPATGTGAGNDIAHLDLSGVQANDSTYQQATGQAYWGVSVLVTDQPTIDPADPLWTTVAVANRGVLSGSLDWNLYFANSVQPVVPGKPYYVHLRFLDGAGNVAAPVINSSGVTPRAFSSRSTVFAPVLTH